MAVPLSDCTIEEQRAIVHFLWAEGVKSAEIHRRMLAQYGAHTVHQRKIYEWIECMDQHIQRVDALIREDRRLTLARVAQVRLTW
jgi:truncated hemoglobin YjbI